MGFKSEMIKARDEFIALVKAELLGPGSEVSVPDAEHELITTVPEKRYSIGILFPKENKMQADGNDVDRAVPEGEKKDAEQAETVDFDASDYIGKDVTVTEKDKKTEDEITVVFSAADLDVKEEKLFLKEELERNAVFYAATEDGSVGTKGNVLDAIRENKLTADVIYACGPTPMLRALKAYAQEQDIECWISMEERMACGIGACLACVCQSKEVDDHSHVHNKRVCKDGPVFLATEVEL